MKLLVSMGAKLENIYMVDSKGVIQSERTDLWGGDQATIVRSIKQRLYTLDEGATVAPNPATTLNR